MRTRSSGIYPWSESDQRRIMRLDCPAKIQRFLDQAEYNTSGIPAIPGEVLKSRRAHCFDGAVFAASVFSFHGEPALILDLCAVNDDDHILAIFKQGGCFGAVAKSNFVGLRYREPIFRNARELVLSYFESYFNLRRQKGLREFSEPFNLKEVSGLDWHRGSAVFDVIADQLIASPHSRLISRRQEAALLTVDARTFQAGLVGSRLK